MVEFVFNRMNYLYKSDQFHGNVKTCIYSLPIDKYYTYLNSQRTS